MFSSSGFISRNTSIHCPHGEDIVLQVQQDKQDQEQGDQGYNSDFKAHLVVTVFNSFKLP